MIFESLLLFVGIVVIASIATWMLLGKEPENQDPICLAFQQGICHLLRDDNILKRVLISSKRSLETLKIMPSTLPATPKIWNGTAEYSRIRVSQYDSLLFDKAQRQFGFPTLEILQSLQTPMVVSKTQGRSKSCFFKTACGRFFFKSLKSKEAETLRKILPDYISFISISPDTLLPQYLGLFALDLGLFYSGSFRRSSHQSNHSAMSEPATLPSNIWPLPKSGRYYFVLMPNIFPDSPDLKFDLKGSTVGRNAFKNATMLSQFFQESIDKSSMTLKEVDHANLCKMKLIQKFQFGNVMKLKLLRQLEMDTAFLKRFKIMDYRYCFSKPAF
jgi:hypothetical protein